MFKQPFYLCMGLLAVALLPMAQVAPPSNKQMVNWLTNKDKIVAEKVNDNSVTFNETEAITLQSGEQAYLSTVEYADSGLAMAIF